MNISPPLPLILNAASLITFAAAFWLPSLLFFTSFDCLLAYLLACLLITGNAFAAQALPLPFCRRRQEHLKEVEVVSLLLCLSASAFLQTEVLTRSKARVKACLTITTATSLLLLSLLGSQSSKLLKAVQCRFCCPCCRNSRSLIQPSVLNLQ